MCIAQVGSEIPKTTGMIRMTTQGGTVHQLMGSDDQHDLPVFPIVVAYNRINHFAPTHYLSDTSLADWRLAQMMRHLECAKDYFEEAQDHINNPPLSFMMLKLSKQMEGVRLSIQERAKRGLFAATNPPVNMHELKPKCSDKLARYNPNPQKPVIHQKLPQPEFSLLPSCTVDHLTVPDIFDEEPDEPVDIMQPVTSASRSASKQAPLKKSVRKPTSTTSSTASSSQPPEPKRKRGAAISARKKASRIEVDEDDLDADEDFNPEDEEEAEVEEQMEEEKGEQSEPTTIQESIVKGIPMERQKRKRKEDDPSYKYICELCAKAFQKTNDLKDHNYVDHFGKTYDCEDCVKHYKSEKALKTHIKTVHDGIGRVKCSEEGCNWRSKDPGTYHNHLLTVHDIGEPIKCNMINSDGQKCGKVFINTRSFTEHKDVHRLKNVECSLCNRMFSSEEKRVIHVRKYHITGTQANTYKCDECGQTLDTPEQLGNHTMLHKLKKHKELKAQQEAQRLYAELWLFLFCILDV